MSEPAPMSAVRRRATQLLTGGAMGGHGAALIVVPLLFVIRGPSAGMSGLIAALAVLAFLGIGQAVQVWFADADPKVLLLATMGSYLIRVGLPVILLLALGTAPERLQGVDRTAVAVAAIVTVLGWLSAEMVVFARLRVPVYDEPEEPRH